MNASGVVPTFHLAAMRITSYFSRLIRCGGVARRDMVNYQLSHMHAPVITQHYVMRHQTGQMAPIVELPVHNFGDSKQFFRHILDEGTRFTTVELCNVHAELEKNGPALLGAVKIHKEMTVPGQIVYAGTPNSEFLGLHAMVLVDCSKHFFLLQTCWQVFIHVWVFHSTVT